MTIYKVTTKHKNGGVHSEYFLFQLVALARFKFYADAAKELYPKFEYEDATGDLEFFAYDNDERIIVSGVVEPVELNINPFKFKF